jgi:dihydroorotate dehydrogenase electron transfer subunit
VTFTTEDGSYGTQAGSPTCSRRSSARCGTGVVYACGPNPMLRAVSERCVELELPVQVAVEERMACGIGVCFTCVLPIRGAKDGSVRMKRACIDGPVFNGARSPGTRPASVGPGPSSTTRRTTPEPEPARRDRRRAVG